MAYQKNTTHNPLEEGILKVGIGKYGSESVPDDLIEPIINQLESKEIPSIQKGAFIGAIFLKGFLSDGEKKIQKYFSLFRAEDIIERFCFQIKKNPILKNILIKLLNNQTLNFDESLIVGKYLFDNELKEEEEFEIGLITTILRFRYETIDEYYGLLKTIEDVFLDSWFPLPEEYKKKCVIITEPFDGVERSFIYTPIIGKIFLKYDIIPIYITSDNPGPKFHYNLKDVALQLNSKFIQSTEELINLFSNNVESEFFHGFYIDVKDLSPILQKWIQRRKLLKKRPFLATLERIYNPIHSHIQIFSAFHPPYLEKTTEILQRKNIPFIFGIRRGEEGGLTFSFNKRNETLFVYLNDKKEYIYKKNTYFTANTQKWEYTPTISDNIDIIKIFLKNEIIEFNEKSPLKEYEKYIHLQIEKTIFLYENFIKEYLSLIN